MELLKYIVFVQNILKKELSSFPPLRDISVETVAFFKKNSVEFIVKIIPATCLLIYYP